MSGPEGTARSLKEVHVLIQLTTHRAVESIDQAACTREDLGRLEAKPPPQSAQRCRVHPTRIAGPKQQAHPPGFHHNISSPGDAQAALHPTPATLGRPRQAAQAALQRLEAFDRGLYAGPFGWLSGDAAEFAVAIRSALLHAPGTCPAHGSASVICGLVVLWAVPMCLKAPVPSRPCQLAQECSAASGCAAGPGVCLSLLRQLLNARKASVH